MHKLRPYLAYFLVLLFLRVLAPEKYVLALHAHEHTEHAHDENVPHFDVKHTHCQADNLFDVPFQLTLQHFVFASPLTFNSYNFSFHSVWKFTFPNNIQLRGPPVA